jgi:hypothetical protein
MLKISENRDIRICCGWGADALHSRAPFSSAPRFGVPDSSAVALAKTEGRVRGNVPHDLNRALCSETHTRFGGNCTIEF